MIYVTHDQSEALTFADRVVVMYDGEVVQTGTPAELFARPAHTFVGYFIGSPGMNLFPARIDGATAHVFDCPLPLGRRYGPVSGVKVEIGVRPEFGALAASGPGLPVAVRRIEDVGRHTIVRATCGGRELAVIAPEGAPVDERAGWVRFDPAAIHVYADGWLVEPERA
jgi:glycerol transport system ATP-binding protein